MVDYFIHDIRRHDLLNWHRRSIPSYLEIFREVWTRDPTRTHHSFLISKNTLAGPNSSAYAQARHGTQKIEIYNVLVNNFLPSSNHDTRRDTGPLPDLPLDVRRLCYLFHYTRSIWRVLFSCVNIVLKLIARYFPGVYLLLFLITIHTFMYIQPVISRFLSWNNIPILGVKVIQEKIAHTGWYAQSALPVLFLQHWMLLVHYFGSLPIFAHSFWTTSISLLTKIWNWLTSWSSLR